jgi:hypothetical protein
MPKDIRQDLLKWLRRTGYPFQLQAGKALQDAGWHVNYSRWYRDPNTEKQREVDLQALTGAVSIGQASLFFSLCIECKTSISPWVGVLSRRDGGGRSFLASAPGLMTRRFVHAAQVLEIDLPNLLPSGIHYADSIVAGFVDDSEDENGQKPPRHKLKGNADPSSPHSALLQTMSAAAILDEELFNTALSVRPEIANAAIVLPVLLFGGRLFAYSVDDQLKDDLTEVDALLVSVPTDNEDNSTLVAVLTERAGAATWNSMYTAAHDFCVAALPFARRIADGLTLTEKQMTEQI